MKPFLFGYKKEMKRKVGGIKVMAEYEESKLPSLWSLYFS